MRRCWSLQRDRVNTDRHRPLVLLRSVTAIRSNCGKSDVFATNGGCAHCRIPRCWPNRFPGSGGQMSVRSTRFAVRRAIGVGAALVVVLAAFAPAAQATQPGPTTSPNVTSPDVTSLRAELRDGSQIG